LLLYKLLLTDIKVVDIKRQNALEFGK